MMTMMTMMTTTMLTTIRQMLTTMTMEIATMTTMMMTRKVELCKISISNALWSVTRAYGKWASEVG